MEERTYRISLTLTEQELDALCLVALADLRTARTQARFFLRQSLAARGVLPETDSPLISHIQPR